MNKYAKELSDAKGKGERDRIKRDFLERLRETVDELITGAERRGAEGGRRNAKAGIVAGTEGIEERGLFGEKESTLRESRIAFGLKEKADEAIEEVAKEVEAVSVSRRGMSDRVAGRVPKSRVVEELREKKRVDLSGRKLTKGRESKEIAEQSFQHYYPWRGMQEG